MTAGERAVADLMIPPWVIVYGGILVVIGAYLLATRGPVRTDDRLRSKGRGLPLPPGPKPFPFLGNLLDMPRQREWETLTKWGRAYGDLVHVTVLGQHLIYINSAKAANDLFEKRSAIYSDRPRLPLLNELMKHDWNFGFFPYGEAWRTHRRLFVSKFGPNAAHLYGPIQEHVSGQLLARLLQTPEDFLDHLRLHAAQLVMRYTYGIEVNSRQDRYVRVAQAVMDAVSAAGKPGAWIVDAFPFLKCIPEWVPGAFYKRLAREWARDVQELRWAPFLDAKSQLADENTETRVSFVTECLEADAGNEKAERMIMDCAALAYGAGSDTSVGTLTLVVLAMVRYPEIQKKAQREIDSVIGSSRLPMFADRPHLPYMTALVKEVIRWHAVAPQGIPHMLNTDDTYNGFFLPAGSIIVGNSWGILHDPGVYPDPMEFKPERFFNSKDQLDYAAIDPSKYAFGYGRRTCPGLHFAEATVWITAAQILAAYDISPIVDSKGRAILPSIDGSSGLLSHPAPFKCTIKPRSEQAVLLVQEADSHHFK